MFNKAILGDWPFPGQRPLILKVESPLLNGALVNRGHQALSFHFLSPENDPTLIDDI